MQLSFASAVAVATRSRFWQMFNELGIRRRHGFAKLQAEVRYSLARGGSLFQAATQTIHDLGNAHEDRPGRSDGPFILCFTRC